MDRRSFFKSLALLAGAASVSPSIFIPKFEPVRWKVAPKPKRWVLVKNLEYDIAQFEQAIICHHASDPAVVAQLNTSVYPYRFNQSASGELIEVPPFILIEEKDYRLRMGWKYSDQGIQNNGERKWAKSFQIESQLLDEHWA